MDWYEGCGLDVEISLLGLLFIVTFVLVGGLILDTNELLDSEPLDRMRSVSLLIEVDLMAAVLWSSGILCLLVCSVHSQNHRF